EIYKLETNYRSTPEILGLANVSIANNKRQFPKTLQPVKKSKGFLPALIPCQDVEQQSAFIASRILELRDEGVSLEDIGVLYRSHYHSLELQLELTRRNIPYRIQSGVRFFEQAHIKDVISYLRIIINPRDELAWKRLLKMIPSVGNATANKIYESLAYAENPFALVKKEDFKYQPRSKQSWQNFVKLLELITSDENRNQPAKQIELILTSGYEQYLQETFENADARAEDLRQLALYASRYDTTEDFLSELALLSTERFKEPTPIIAEDVIQGGEEDELLTLTSIHQAKGAEWKAVFIIWTAEGKFPSPRALKEFDSEEEERRLWYVALTRAKDELYLTYPLMMIDYSRQTVLQKPSRFILEVPPAMFELWSLEEPAPKFDAPVEIEAKKPEFLN
ncbi:MAG: ATP-dependent helicase, partial [Pyrinomonadaceae bacterium]